MPSISATSHTSGPAPDFGETLSPHRRGRNASSAPEILQLGAKCVSGQLSATLVRGELYVLMMPRQPEPLVFQAGVPVIIDDAIAAHLEQHAVDIGGWSSEDDEDGEPIAAVHQKFRFTDLRKAKAA